MHTIFVENDYDSFFPGLANLESESNLKQSFLKAFISIVTRCFGWGLPKTSMIPFADCINHHTVDSTYELINVKYHGLSEDDPERGPDKYYSQTKMEANYSDFFLH